LGGCSREILSEQFQGDPFTSYGISGGTMPFEERTIVDQREEMALKALDAETYK